MYALTVLLPPTLSIGTMDSLQLFVYVFKKAPEAYIYTSKLFVPHHFCTYKNATEYKVRYNMIYEYNTIRFNMIVL